MPLLKPIGPPMGRVFGRILNKGVSKSDLFPIIRQIQVGGFIPRPLIEVLFPFTPLTVPRI